MDRTASCPSCRGSTYADDAFCSWCGERVQARVVNSGESSRALAARSIATAQRQFCESCHSPILDKDVYCATCGARCGATQPTVERMADTWAKIPQQISEATGGKYEFVRELGRGGMGVVFMARDRELKRSVAIKVLSSNWLTDESMVARFQNEARTIASLNHESIITVFDVGRAGSLHYFVMDYVEGVSLSRVLRTYGRLPIPVVEAIFYRVALALSHAHRPKPDAIIHRDIKPSNIMLDTEGHVVVMDFGISKVSERPSGLTSTGLVMGTPEYMSPEQCRGHTVTPKSDQYSLGTVVYAMLTGAPPFTGPFYQVLMAHQMEPVPSILAVRPDCSPELAAATERMLAKVPGERWPSLIDAVKALGLKPLGLDDPVLDQIGQMVRDASDPVPAQTAPDPRTADSRTPTSIRIVPKPGSMEVGDELTLNATVIFQGGAEETRGRVAWGSTDPAIVRVDPSTGQLVAVGAGAAVVTASGAGVIGTVAIDVSPPRVAGLTIEPGDMTIDEGSTVVLRARARSKRGLTLERPITWSSSDPITASVGSDGLVTSKKPGTVRILAHCDGVDATTVLRVAAAPVQSWAEPAPEPAPEPEPEERWSVPTPAPARPWATATLDSFSTAEPSAPESEGPGSLRVEASEAGVAIAILQGTRMVALGKTPWTSGSLPAGDYRVMVRDPRYLPDGGAVTVRSGEEARVELTATLRPTRAPVRSYLIKAFVPLAVASVALLIWTLLKSEPGATQPAEMPIAEFEDHLARGDVLGVRVQQGMLAVQLGESSDTVQVSLAGLPVQEILGRIAGRGVPIVAEGEGSVRLGAVRAGSGEAIPAAPLSVMSMAAGGCGPCPPERLAAGWYAIQSDTIAGSMNSFQMSSADGLYRAETLPPGAQVFVLGGAVFDLTATLIARVSPDSVSDTPPPPTTGTIRVDRQGLPTSTLIFLDGQMMSGSSFTVSPGPHRLRANALNFQDDSTVVTVRAGEVARPWRPTFVAVVVERPPERPAVPSGRLDALRGGLGLTALRLERSEYELAIRGFLQAQASVDSLFAAYAPNPALDSLRTAVARGLADAKNKCQNAANIARTAGRPVPVCP